MNEKTGLVEEMAEGVLQKLKNFNLTSSENTAKIQKASGRFIQS